MKKLLKVLFVLVLGLSLTACSTNDGGDDTKKTLKVGMECAYAPYNWYQDDAADYAANRQGGGYCAGFDVSIAKAIAEEAGYELEVVQIEWDGLINALNADMIDFIIAGMSPTEDRKLSIDFSDNYYLSELVIVVEKDGDYANATSISDFAGANLVAQLGTFHDTVIDQINGVKHETPMESFPAMIAALNSGRIDGYIAEKPGALSAVQTNANLTYVEFEEGKGFTYSDEDAALAVGVKKGNTELMSICNNALSKITVDQREQMMLDALEHQPAAE